MTISKTSEKKLCTKKKYSKAKAVKAWDDLFFVSCFAYVIKTKSLFYYSVIRSFFFVIVGKTTNFGLC